MQPCLHNKNQRVPKTRAKKLQLSGKVQGVGFRPFIYRLAITHNLTGWVKNCLGTVEIYIQGQEENIDHFINDIFDKKMPLAEPLLVSTEEALIENTQSFSILPSKSSGETNISLPTDLFLCDDCLSEINDPKNRRYRYPFTNCTQCGPRYTLINKLPYDRANTTMAQFKMCPACRDEYEDPTNRRFHAEPIACPTCGPSLSLHINSKRDNTLAIDETLINNNEISLKFTVESLRNGKILAVKGIGGYHLICDANNTKAVSDLRNSKKRADKPFAVMFPSPADKPFFYVEKNVILSEEDKKILLQPSRPILLVSKKEQCALSEFVAPKLNEVGIMLPYSPLHHLLLNDFSGALVATSANISGEPVLTENDDVEIRLAHIADAFLHHNRPIKRPADDPVYKTIAKKARPIRTGRGSSPLELPLPFTLEQPVLAVGAHMKNTVTLAWENRAVVSPHIGEMGSARSLQVFEDTVNDLQALYNVQASAIICDAHPAYTTTHWANKKSLPVHSVFHHHAHASSAYYECNTDEAVIAFSWDGVGYGEDGTLWGGETFVGKPKQWQRVASMRPFNLPGGDKAGREPWRSAAALCWQAELNYKSTDEQSHLLHQAWQRKINTPQTTSVGRLFDAAAALIGLCTHASFEGQGPMQLEALCKQTLQTMHNDRDIFSYKHIQLPLENHNNVLRTNWQALIEAMLNDKKSINERALTFHLSMAHVILQQAKAIRDAHNINTVTFSGGVFQNSVLSECAIKLLNDNNFKVYLPELIPVNDASISFGQVIEHGF